MDFASGWPTPDQQGVPLHGELTNAPGGHRERKAVRIPAEFPAGLRQRGASGVAVQIMDLSTDGFRAATHLELAPGADVWLRLPGLEASHARVMWARGHYVGCAFVRPLHPAVLDMVVAKGLGR